MLQIETIITNCDNTGIVTGKVIHIYKKSEKKITATLKDHVLIASQKTDFRKIPKKKITRAIVVKTKKKIKRLSGHCLSFKKSGVIALYENDTFKGTTIKGPIAAEIRFQPITDIISTAKAVI